MELKAIIAFSFLIIFAVIVALMLYGHYRKPARYKIVEVTHANGEVDYTIKTSSFPFYFIWVTVKEDYGLYLVKMKGVESIERAKEFISKYEESDRKELGKRVINRRNVN